VTVYLKVQIKLIERLQTKWFDAQIQWKWFKRAANYMTSAYICSKFTRNKKKKRIELFCPILLRHFPLKSKFSWSFQQRLNRVLLYIQVGQ
jgi:hypothetical protein